MRFIGSWPQVLATATDDGVQVHQYAAAEIAAGGLRFLVDTAYPWSGEVGLTVVEAPEEAREIALRIPSWCETASLRDAERPVGELAGDGRSIRATRVWQPGDSLVLDLAMPPRVTAPHPSVDAIRGCVALERGPLVYALETADIPARVDLEDLALPMDAASGDDSTRRHRPFDRRAERDGRRPGRPRRRRRRPVLRLGQPRRERHAGLDPASRPVTASALRDEVAAANRAIAGAGLVMLSFGNVSGVDRDAGTLLIKPSGLACADVGPDDLVEVALDDGRVVSGDRRPSTDTPTHRHLYLEFGAIGGVVHTHSTSAAAWAQAGRPIPALGTTHADYFRGPVLVSRHLHRSEIEGDYEWATGEVIAETIRQHQRTAEDSPGVLVRAHGPFAWGAHRRRPSRPRSRSRRSRRSHGGRSESIRRHRRSPMELLRRHFDRKHGPAAYYGQPAPEADGAEVEARP